MAVASWALQHAIHHVLTANANVVALLGGPHVWDHVPRGAAAPYVTFGVTTERDWSTGSDAGGEHILTLKRVEVKYSIAELVSKGVTVRHQSERAKGRGQRRNQSRGKDIASRH